MSREDASIRMNSASFAFVQDAAQVEKQQLFNPSLTILAHPTHFFVSGRPLDNPGNEKVYHLPVNKRLQRFIDQDH